MLAATVGFVGLGFWQLQRLEFKRELISAADTRVGAAPVALPPAAEWGGLAPEDYDFTPVRFDGRYADQAPILVFTTLVGPRGPLGGPGYWVMHEVELAEGWAVWVNRGFVPDDRLSDYAPPPGAAMTLTGLMRRPERANWFTPPSDPAGGRDYVRDPARFFGGEAGLPGLAPFTIDLARTGEGLPQAGETKIDFPNRHLEYALTWFALAAVTPVMLAIWLRRRGRSAQLAPPGARD